MIRSRASLLGLALAIGIAGCGGVAASPTPAASTAAAPYPPPPVAQALASTFRIGLRPLSDAERALVAISQTDAIRTALTSRGVGMPGPNGSGEVVWTSAGFVYLAAYTPPPTLGYGGPGPSPMPIAAYLVQVLAPAIPGFPGDNTALVIVDARTGALGATMGPCVGALCGAP
jgi:hypothetical protein